MSPSAYLAIQYRACNLKNCESPTTQLAQSKNIHNNDNTESHQTAGRSGHPDLDLTNTLVRKIDVAVDHDEPEHAGFSVAGIFGGRCLLSALLQEESRSKPTSRRGRCDDPNRRPAHLPAHLPPPLPPRRRRAVYFTVSRCHLCIISSLLTGTESRHAPFQPTLRPPIPKTCALTINNGDGRRIQSAPSPSPSSTHYQQLGILQHKRKAADQKQDKLVWDRTFYEESKSQKKARFWRDRWSKAPRVETESTDVHTIEALRCGP